MACLYSKDHVYVGATYVKLPANLARIANRRGTARIPADTKVEVLEVICVQCRRPYDAVEGQPCAAADDTTRDHLIGGPAGSSATGERKKRNHREPLAEPVGYPLTAPLTAPLTTPAAASPAAASVAAPAAAAAAGSVQVG